MVQDETWYQGTTYTISAQIRTYFFLFFPEIIYAILNYPLIVFFTLQAYSST